jgi:hypothetical protein
LVPVAWLSRANDPLAWLSAAAINFSNAALLTPVAAGSPRSIIVVAISTSARFVKWLTSPDSHRGQSPRRARFRRVN